MKRKNSKTKSGFGDRLLFVLQLCCFGPREAHYRRIKQWILKRAEKQAEAWGTSIERFRQEHFDLEKLQEATGLADDEAEHYSRSSKVDSGSVAVMQKLVAQYSLSSGLGKPGSRVWAPDMIAAALVGLDATMYEQDWRFLLFSALCELVRQRGALEGEWDIRIALDAAYIVMLYTRLGPSAKAAARLASGFRDELVQLRLTEAEEHLLEELPW